jgi:hypothetical protein
VRAMKSGLREPGHEWGAAGSEAHSFAFSLSTLTSVFSTKHYPNVDFFTSARRGRPSPVESACGSLIQARRAHVRELCDPEHPSMATWAGKAVAVQCVW